MRVCDAPPTPNEQWDSSNPDPATSTAPYRVYNIGNNDSVELSVYIETLDRALGRTAKKEMLPMQPGDIPDTFADVSDLVHDFDYQPRTTVEEGIRRFVEWYVDYYQVTL